MRALVRGAIAPRGRIERFEREAERFFAARHAVAAGSGRGALAAILESLDLSPGDEILIPALTFGAVPETVRRLGLAPVFFDVSERDLLGDVEDAARKISRRTRAVICTHLLGVPSDVRAFCDLGVVMIEDAAQAAGALAGGRFAGTIGRAGFTSLETVKPLAAFGGGLAFTADDAIASQVRARLEASEPPSLGRLAKKIALGHLEALASQPAVFGLVVFPLIARSGDAEGWVERYKARKKGGGNHERAFTAAQAEVGRVNLAHLPAHLEERRRNAERLRSMLAGQAWLQALREGDSPSWYHVVARTREPERLTRAALAAGVDVARGAVTDVSGGKCAVAARMAREVVQLPSHPGLTDDDLARVAEAVAPWLI